MAETYTTFLAGLRTDFVKAVVPAVAKIYLQKDLAEPAVMIAQTAWDIANKLAWIELAHQESEEEKNDDRDR